MKTVILEEWDKSGYAHRLVTDGVNLWLEYHSLYVPQDWTKDNRVSMKGWEGETHANWYLPIFGEE